MELCELGKAERESWWKAIETSDDWWAEFCRPWEHAATCPKCQEAIYGDSTLRLEVAVSGWEFKKAGSHEEAV